MSPLLPPLSRALPRVERRAGLAGKNIFATGGQRKRLKSLKTAKEIQAFSLAFPLPGFAESCAGLAGFGFAWKNFEISTWVAQRKPRGFSGFCPRE